MLEFWQHLPEKLNPILFSIGPVQVRWYGLMYVCAFTSVYFLVLFRLKKEKYNYTPEIIEDFFLWGILGVLAGGRLGYVLFYNFSYFLAHPLEVVLPFTFSGGFRFTGIYGMSYHGGLLGVATAFILFCRAQKINFWNFVDLFIPAIALSYTFGRLGNFLNGELYGRVTQAPWGMYFPSDLTHQLRHPSQLYEAFFEGVFLFILLWNLRKIKKFDGFLFSIYLIGYGAVRFLIEFMREPDAHLGFILGPFTMGQILCAIMIAAGGLIWGINLLRPSPKKTS